MAAGSLLAGNICCLSWSAFSDHVSVCVHAGDLGLARYLPNSKFLFSHTNIKPPTCWKQGRKILKAHEDENLSYIIQST